MMRWNELRGALSLVAVLALGCPFYDVPGPHARNELFRSGAWLRSEPSKTFACFADLDDAVDEEWKVLGVPEDRKKRKVPLRCRSGSGVSFLHLSDAQIRDENAYGDVESLNSLHAWDLPIGVSIRRELVEGFDSLTLASFLVAHAKVAGDRNEDPFVIHTGDLLDVSLVTELMEAMAIFREVETSYPQLRIYSVPGNHDGLTFGNISDHDSDTRGLGINKTEFVLAHLLAGGAENSPYPAGWLLRPSLPPDEGFGFARNEILQAVRHTKEPFDANAPPTRTCNAACRESVREWYDEIAEFHGRAYSSRTGARTNVPIAYRNLVDVAGSADENPFRVGYYAWSEPVSTSAPGQVESVRFVVLDTRRPDQSEGTVDRVQLGWLYNELASALARSEPVVVVAHHGPSALRHHLVFPDWSRTYVNDLLAAFPNVVAFLYGHGHENHPLPRAGTARPIRLQTGSLADFPQAGREVALCFEDGKATLDWEFVRPSGRRKKSPLGPTLDGVLDASRKDAEKEHASESFLGWRAVSHALAPALVRKFDGLDWHDYQAEKLPPGSRTVSVGLDPAACRDAEDVFGAGLLAEIQALRKGLGLAEVLPTCPEPDAAAAPEPSPVAPDPCDGGRSWAPRAASALASVGGGTLLVSAADDLADWLDRIAPACADEAQHLRLPEGAGRVAGIRALATVTDREVLAIAALDTDDTRQPDRDGGARIRLDPTLGSVEAIRILPPLRPAVLAALSERGGFDLAELSRKKPGEGGLVVEGATIDRHGFLALGVREPVLPGGGAFVVTLDRVAEIGRCERDAPSARAEVMPALPNEGVLDLTTWDSGHLVLLGGSRNRDRIPRRLVHWSGGLSRPVEVASPTRAQLEEAEGIAILHDGRIAVAYNRADSAPVQIFDLELSPARRR